MSGQRPPEWGDPDDGHPDDGHPDAGLPDRGHPDAGYSDHDLSEVTSLLASVRSPALPASFEARISAAIAAEAAARATTEPRAAAEPAGPLTAAAGADDAKDRVRSADPEGFSPAATAGGPSAPAGRRPRRGARTSRSAARASRPGSSRPDGRRRRLRMPSMQAASWVLVSCLVLAGFGFLVTRGSGSSASSSYAASAASSQSASAPAAGVPKAAAGRASEQQPGDANDKPSAGAPTAFLVYSTGTAYERSTLASQVRAQLGSHDFGGPGPAAPDNSAGPTAPAPAASSAASTSGVGGSTSGVGGSTPSPGLSGCVSKVTGGAAPSLVDRASYDGIPAYIIAVPTRVWVVRLGCTATDTQLIAAVPLAGEPGISAP
jgi:hypothetical protein